MTSGQVMYDRKIGIDTPHLSQLADEPSAAAVEHIGMITKEERSLLLRIAKRLWRGEGLIIDAGAYLGASTRLFFEGIQANENLAAAVAKFGKPIHSFERAVAWEGFETRLLEWGYSPSDIPPPGGSYAPILLALVEPFDELVEMHVGDILDYEGPSEPVEVLFIDIAKTPAVAEKVARLWFPQLVEGAYVIQQDYFFYKLSYLKLLQEYFSDHFEHVASASTSSVFQLVKPISTEQVDAYYASKLSREQKYRLHRKAERRAETRRAAIEMKLSSIELMIECQDFARADNTLRVLRQEVAEFDEPVVLARLERGLIELERLLSRRLQRWLNAKGQRYVGL